MTDIRLDCRPISALDPETDVSAAADAAPILEGVAGATLVLSVGMKEVEVSGTYH